MVKKQKIVFLDAATVDLGDVDNFCLSILGSYRAFPDTPPARLIARARDADVLITNKCVLDGFLLGRLPRLKLLCVAATGVNNIDLAAARRLGIAVANVPGYSTSTVAEHTLMLLLALAHRLPEHLEACRSGAWTRSPSFALLDFPYQDLAGKVLGLVGYGSIGRKVARLARAFGMTVLIAKLPGRKYPPHPKRTALRALLRKADFVSLHCPLTAETRGLIYRDNLRLMKPSACLLNLARGPLVREEDVAAALSAGRLRAYAADVMGTEPPPRTHPLLARTLRDRVLLTPHVAWASRESRQRLLDEIAENIRAFRSGRRRNRVA